jgi:outer membrane receptor for ferrienterochelin and colicin
MRTLKHLIVFLFCLVLTAPSFGQLDSMRIQNMTREEIQQLSQDELLDMSMEELLLLSQKMGISIDELLNMKTTVASKKVLTPRETPGIVTIITAEEIKYSGARDMIDVLRLVPGFDFGYDVQGVVGVGLRGNWVHEGKILMLIDGQQMNEMSYYNIPFGNHFPVDQIKRIEIIRGPGSAIYGGNAELGVINIITKTGQDTEGVGITATYGQMQKAMGRTNLNINSGFTRKDWDFSAKGFIGMANRSDQPFTEYVYQPENVIQLSGGGSEIKSQHINIGANNKNLSFRLIYDNYKTWYNSYEDSIVGNTGIYNQFRSILGEVKYDLKINEKLSLIPRINYNFSRPYFEKDYWRSFHNNRYAGSLMLNYLISRNSTLSTGVEWHSDNAHCIYDTGYFYSNNKPDMQINNLSMFAEGTVKLRKVNLTAGFRAENNSVYGWALAPRLGATAIFNKFHFKTLFSGAFRAPGFGNIDVSSDIRPEKSFVSEIELGYRLNNNMFVTANIFDIKISNSIIYYDNGGWTPGLDWGYKNAENAGSDGFELEFKSMYAKGFATVNYSFYTQAYRPVPATYSVPGKDNSALGLPQHKVGLLLNYMPVTDLSICPSLVILGTKYGYDRADGDGNPVVDKFRPSALLNLAITYDNLLVRGLDISVSAFDLFNQKPPFIQPYNGQFVPYPGRSREILVKLSLSTDVFK